MPLDTFYLPKESISYVNYPILREQQKNIEAIMAYALRVHSAITDYNENVVDKIDINMDELNQYLALCRSTAEALGTAENVPFDVLLEIRNIMAMFLNLVYLHRSFGSTIIGTPTSVNTSEGSGL